MELAHTVNLTLSDHIGGFRREFRAVAFAPGFTGDKIDLVLPQKAPDILNVNIT